MKHGRKFLEIANLIVGEADHQDYSSASASLAVLAGVAASDAACCRALGVRSRGQDHRQAIELLGQIEPGGSAAASALRRLLDLKDQAHYGLFDVSGADLRAALRQADSLMKFADSVLRR